MRLFILGMLCGAPVAVWIAVAMLARTDRTPADDDDFGERDGW